MFRCFYPTVYYDSAYEIDFRELYRKGYRGLLTDVDNTLVEHGAPIDERSAALMAELKEMGWSVCVISNNDEERVSPFADAVHCPYIYKAGKPKKDGYETGMKRIGTSRENTVFLGDQLFTDIWGANRSGIPSILVKPIARDPEFHILLKRVGEAVVKMFYRRYAARHPRSL